MDVDVSSVTDVKTIVCYKYRLKTLYEALKKNKNTMVTIIETLPDEPNVKVERYLSFDFLVKTK